jgi:type I restriction enzyme M protein
MVNMIFRGNGKNNIREGNCFHTFIPAVTKVLMNPPFALSTDKEYKFVTYALTQMQRGGLLFAIVPTAVFLPVITLPSDVF